MWILTGCTIFAIGPYTGLVMMEDIGKLRGNKDGSNETFFHPTRQFVAQNFQVVHPIYTFSFFATTFFRENETGFNFFRETFNCNC